MRNEATVADEKGTGTLAPVPARGAKFFWSPPLIAAGCRGPVKVTRVKLDFQTAPFQAGSDRAEDSFFHFPFPSKRLARN